MHRNSIQSILAGLLLLFCACQRKTLQKALPGFDIVPVSESLQQQMVEKNVFGPGSPVPIERLRLLRIRHYDFEGLVQNGEIMVLDACSAAVSRIFQELYHCRFPLQRVALMTAYYGTDSLSMAANNSSAHNFRMITGQKRLSLHAYGTAIDINPMQNPFIDIPCQDTSGHIRILPVGSSKYANRNENRPGKQLRQGLAEQARAIFARNGFYGWGGNWDCPIDYQHFQLSRSVSEVLVAMPAVEAERFFNQLQRYFVQKKRPLEDVLLKYGGGASLSEFYLRDPKIFQDLVVRLAGR